MLVLASPEEKSMYLHVETLGLQYMDICMKHEGRGYELFCLVDKIVIHSNWMITPGEVVCKEDILRFLCYNLYNTNF